MKAINNRLQQFDKANSFGIKLALFTFIVICLIAIGYFFIDDTAFIVLSIPIGFIAILLNSIVIITVLFNAFIKKNGFKESLFTMYVIILNIPIGYSFLLINDYLNHQSHLL